LKKYYEREVKANWNRFVHWALANVNGNCKEESGKNPAEEFLLPDDFEVYYERYLKPFPTSESIDVNGCETAGQVLLEATFTVPTGLPHGILNLDDLWAQTPDYEKMVLDFRGRIYQDILRMESVLQQRAAKSLHQSGARDSDLEGVQEHELRVDELFSFLPSTSYAQYTPDRPRFLSEEDKELLELMECD
jgi:hypothetical protein